MNNDAPTTPFSPEANSVGRKPLHRLLPRHHKIIELALDGFAPANIAGMMGMSTVGVRYILMDHRVQDELARRKNIGDAQRDDLRANASSLARDTLNELTVDAVEKLGEIMASEQTDITNQRLAAKHILDKAFGEQGASGGSGRPAVIVNIEQMNVLNQALRECGYNIEKKGEAA